MKKEPLIPDQQVGFQKDSTQALSFDHPEAAKAFFQVARARLLDVNRWHQLCEGPSSTFTLHEAAGNRVDRPAQVGDYFEIAIPGPGPTAGDGADWVRIEAIEDQRDDIRELTTMRVRPTPSPRNDDADVAHFLHDGATSTFLVARTGTTVSAEVHGRNEVPNTDTESMLDKVRNAATAVVAFLGFADAQWNQLVKALMRQEG